MNDVAWKAYQKMKRSWMAKDIKIMGLNTLDLASRVNVALAVYVPQFITSIATKTREWETNSRNVVSWLVTLGLGMWTKGGGLPKWINKTFMQNEKLGFDPQYMYRAIGLSVPDGGLRWDKLELNVLNQIDDFARELNNPESELGKKLLKDAAGTTENKDELEQFLRGRFALKNHELEALKDIEKLEGKFLATEYAHQLKEHVPKFISRINGAKFWQMAISTALFTVVVGQMVMLFIWGTFARLDSEFDASKNPLKSLGKRFENLFSPAAKKQDIKPLSPMERFMRLPSRVVQNPHSAETYNQNHQAYQGVNA